jgi:hypothetical protein
MSVAAVVLGPDAAVPALPLATFRVTGASHTLVVARLRCRARQPRPTQLFPCQPLPVHLVGLDAGRDRPLPDAFANTTATCPAPPGQRRAVHTEDDVDWLVAAVVDIASGRRARVACHQDRPTGDFHVEDGVAGGSHATAPWARGVPEAHRGRSISVAECSSWGS